jgi:hypothetical protein
MPFPIVAVAVGAVAVAVTPYLLYGSLAYLPDVPSSMDAASFKSAEDALAVVHTNLIAHSWDYAVTNHVPYGKSCVEASESRGPFIAGLLSSEWEVFSCTVSAGTHTFNVVRFKGNYWIVDSYVIVYIKYIGGSIPVGMAITPMSRSYRGRA